MPKEQRKHAVTRQRPVSCRFCRSRKLRCSRDSPCKNWVARGIQCELDDAVERPCATPIASEAGLLERIRNLEEIVKRQASVHDETTGQQHFPAPDSRGLPESSSNLSQLDGGLDNEVAWLESIYSTQEPVGTMSSSRIILKVCSIRQAADAPLYFNANISAAESSLKPSRCIWLPQQFEAKMLVDKFLRDIEHVHHITHTTTLPQTIIDIYACLNQQGQVEPGYLILLLSIIASCTHSWVQKDGETGLFTSPAEARGQAYFWIKAIEDVLDIAHRTASVSIEGVQGVIITSFVLGNLEGMSRRARSLYNLGLLLARELGLHCIDHPSKAYMARSVQAEIGRRIWWYIVASEWSIAARIGGAMQGIYQCHLRQMRVTKPLKIDDEDLIDGTTYKEQPSSQPTGMSYFLQRIRLAEISRNIVDRIPITMAQNRDLSYDIVMDIDTELQILLNETSIFFSMSSSELTRSYQIEPSKAAKIVHQGYSFRSLLHSQRCKLHFSYFSRGFEDSKYASSREICLLSARAIISNESKLEDSEISKMNRFKFLGLCVSIFMASIIILMDLCHNKSSSRKEAQRREIAEAFRILEAASNESETVSKFLDSMMQVLRKYRVALPKRIGTNAANDLPSSEHTLTAGNGRFGHDPSTTRLYDTATMAAAPAATADLLQSNCLHDTSASGNDLGFQDEIPPYFREFTESLEYGFDIGALDWNDVLAGLDS